MLGFNGLCFDLLKLSCGSTYHLKGLFCMGMYDVLMFQHIILVGFKLQPRWPKGGICILTSTNCTLCFLTRIAYVSLFGLSMF